MKTPQHSKRKHSDFSPSSAKRWMSCPGSVRLARLAPPQVDSEAASEGTRAHECLEFVVRRFRDLKSAEKEARKRWPEEMVGHAVNSAVRLFSSDLRGSDKAELLIETRVRLKTVSTLIFGTLDYAWVERWGDLCVADYKYGRHLVQPRDYDGELNPQLMVYAYGVAEKHDFDFDGIKLAIIQPRTVSEGEDPVTWERITVKELREFGKKLKASLEAAKSPVAPLVSGDHCRWCPALATCPKQSADALEKANIVFDVDDGIQAAPSPFLLTPDRMPRILEGCKALEEWIKAVRAEADRMALEDRKEIPGYKVVQRRANRTWTPEAPKIALARFGAMAFEVPEPKLLSPAQMEKKLGVQGKGFVSKHAETPFKGYELVPVTDKRPAVEGPTLLFDHHDET
jgi:hypothetical protein